MNKEGRGKAKIQRWAIETFLNNYFSILFLSPEGLPFENRVHLPTDTPGKMGAAGDTRLTIPLEKGVKRGKIHTSVQAPRGNASPL